jgi:hypothetical protein
VYPQPLRGRGVLALTARLAPASLAAGRLPLGRLKLRSLVLGRSQARGHALWAED